MKPPLISRSQVPPKLALPLDRLTAFLSSLFPDAPDSPPTVRAFAHGQSNPTYFLTFGGHRLVLRKKPPGRLLPSAHAVEREFRVMQALRPHGVPLPKVLALCEDPDVIGTPFYVMEYQHGRVFKDHALLEMSPNDRAEIYTAMNRALVAIHAVDVDKAGLADYGKRSGYMRRNFERWVRQYEASLTDNVEAGGAMDQLITWLRERLPEQDSRCSVVHGDFRLDNLVRGRVRRIGGEDSGLKIL